MKPLDRCRDIAQRFYTDLLGASVTSLRDRLFEQSEQASNNADQRCYFEAMQQLNQYENILRQVFEEKLSDAYRDFTQGVEREHSIDEKISIDKLSLVQREELEDDLAISVIISKANSQNTESLWKLNRRMAVLRGGKAVGDETNPFGPTLVCNALHDGISVLDVDIKARVFIYKHLGKLFLGAFGKILQQLNEELVAQGILPNLKFSISRQQGAAPADTAQPASPAVEAVPETGASEPGAAAAQQQLYDTIVQLQAQLMQARGPRVGTLGGVSYGQLQVAPASSPGSFNPMDLVLALSAVQQSNKALATFEHGRPLAIDDVEARFFDTLNRAAREEGRHELARDDADTIDVVGMIFRYMLDDDNLPDAVKSQLSHLHTPYLKLALLDPDFLKAHDHPARLLLNGMAEVGGRWVESERDKTVLPKLKAIVEQVLRSFVDDVSLFDRLLMDFQRFRDGLEKRAEMVEKRNREAQQGIERLNSAKVRAGVEIDKRFREKGVGEDIKRLLEKPWTDFLAYTLLRHGDDGLSWSSALKVVDGVLWSVQPSVSEQSREAYLKRQQELDKSIREGLAAIGYHEEAGDQLLQSLRQAQELAYKAGPRKITETEAAAEPASTSGAGARAAPEPVSPPAGTERSPAEAGETDTPRAAVSEDVPEHEPEITPEVRAMMDQLQDMKFGTWFEFERPGEAPQRLKLAWYSRVSARYMFVNQAGVKQAVESLASLADGICDGRIRQADFTGKSFMERALEAVLGRLRRLGSAPAENAR